MRTIIALRGFATDGVEPCVLLSRDMGGGWFRNSFLYPNDLGEVWA